MRKLLLLILLPLLFVSCKKKRINQNNVILEGEWIVVSRIDQGVETIGDYSYMTWEFDIVQGTGDGVVVMGYDEGNSAQVVNLDYYLRNDPAVQFLTASLYSYTFSNNDNTLYVEDWEYSSVLADSYTLERVLN